MNPIVVRLAPDRERTRLLATSAGQDLLKAVLGPARLAHRRAAATLLEGLALWHQQRLSVVLSAGELDGSCDALGLCDALGFGEPNLHFDLTVAVDGDHPARKLRGLGDFRDLRRLSGEVW
jgi:hypothetical protein